MEFYVFEKDSGLRSFVKDSLYTVNCPKAEEVYVIAAIQRLREVCDELTKYEGADDKNSIKLDEVADFKRAAACIVKEVLDCNEKSKDGYYYYCEEAKEPIPEEYFQGYEGVRLVDVSKVNEIANLYGPEYVYCYTFTKNISTK